MLTEELKRQTDADHERLDEQPLLAALMSPRLRLEEYREVMGRMRSCFEAAEPAIAGQLGVESLSDWHYASKLPHLARDCEVLHSPKTQPGSLSLADRHEALGALYVLFGSSLGGRFIVKNVTRTLSLGETTGAAFYQSALEDLDSWMEFKKRLNEAYLGHNSPVEAVVRGARKCFTLFTDSFEKSLAQ